MRGVHFLIPLFFWMTTDDVAVRAQLCSFSAKGYCPKEEICAFTKTPRFDAYRCVKAEECVGQSGGQCPAQQDCISTNTQTFACVPIACSESSNGTCPSGQACTPHKPTNGDTTTYACKKVVRKGECGGQSKGTCPPDEKCKNGGPPGGAPSFSCRPKTYSCGPNFSGTCPPDKKCTKKSNKLGLPTLLDFGPVSYSCEYPECSNEKCPENKVCNRHNHCVDEPVCGGQSDGKCPAGQECKKKKPIGVHSCVDIPQCGGQSKGQCPRGQVCNESPLGSNTFSCEAKKNPCITCPPDQVCRESGPPEAKTYSCIPVQCAKDRDCKADEFCNHEAIFFAACSYL